MRADKYKDLLDKVHCRPDFRKRMEEKLSADRTEVHEYFDVVRDVEKAPSGHRFRGYLPVFAAGAAILGIFGIMVLTVKDLPQDEMREGASLSSEETTAATETEAETKPPKAATVVEMFENIEWIRDDLQIMPIEYVSSDSKNQRTLTGENGSVHELREKLIDMKWTESAGFDSSNYFKIGNLMINQKGQISDGVNVYKLLEDKSAVINEIARKAFIECENFKGKEVIAELFIDYSWQLENSTIRNNIDYCADCKPFINTIYSEGNTIKIRRESCDIKPVIEILLKADWKQVEEFDSTEYFNLGSIEINSKGQIKLPDRYYYDDGRVNLIKEPNIFQADEEFVKKINQYIDDNFWDKLSFSDEMTKKIIQSGTYYEKMSADVKVQYYSIWNGKDNGELEQEKIESYQEYIRRRKTISGEGKLYLDLKNNEEKVKIEGNATNFDKPVTATLDRSEDSVKYTESSEGVYSISKDCLKEHQDRWQDKDGVWHYNTSYYTDIPELDYSQTAHRAAQELSQEYYSGYDIKVLTDEEKKDLKYDAVLSVQYDEDIVNNIYIGIDEKTGIVDYIQKEYHFKFETGEVYTESYLYELDNIKYDSDAQKIE